MSINPFCKYHPKITASWICPHCSVYFCADCVPQGFTAKGDKEIYPKCTLCRYSLNSLSIAEQIPPFWDKLSYFLSIPLSKSSSIVLFSFALLVSLLPDGKIGMIIFFVMLFPLSEFLFELMERVASGEKITRQPSNIFTSENKGMFLKMLFTYAFVVILVVKVTSILGVGVGYSLAAFFILSAPASLIILMMEKNIFSMVNPFKIIHIIKLFSHAYFFLYFIALGSFFIGQQFNAIAEANTQNFLTEFIANIISMYLAIVVFSMMGYLVFQHHFELNYGVRSTNFQSLKSNTIDEMVEVDIFIQEARFEDAQKILLNKISINSMNYKANEKLILLYAVQENFKHLKKIADRYFSVLVKKDKQTHAADFYFKLYNKSVDYFPESYIALILAEQMNNKSQYNAALTLLEHFSCEPGREKDWDKISLLKAKVLAEFAGDNNAAIFLLKNILKRSVDQNLLVDAESYLDIVLN